MSELQDKQQLFLVHIQIGHRGMDWAAPNRGYEESRPRRESAQ